MLFCPQPLRRMLVILFLIYTSPLSADFSSGSDTMLPFPEEQPAPGPEPMPPESEPEPEPRPDPAPDPIVPPEGGFTAVDAARLLTQATFGPSPVSIGQCMALGAEAWVDGQLSLPATLHLPDLLAVLPEDDDFWGLRTQVWWRHALHADDQLRQRMAFALSQIMVVSEQGSALEDFPVGLTYYYDLLVGNAFGNFRDLLRDVTLSPAMGLYLGMLGNQKADEEQGIRPDENFAREIMQLFTIGLVELNPDGTPTLDENGEQIPTYDQDDVKALARVFTGWTTRRAEYFEYPSEEGQALPMEAWEDYHDQEEKTALGSVFAAGQGAQADLDQALNVLFYHPNVGPFIGRQLIQRLVTSNPTADYVARISAVFNDNGQGVRGDLAAVTRAILLDPEARYGHLSDPDNFGKLREPLLMVSHLWRAFGGASGDGVYRFDWAFEILGQGPLQSPSVFNFYRPDFAPQGQVEEAGLVAPEFQIATDNALVRLGSLFIWFVQYSPAEFADNPEHIVIDLSTESVLAADVNALLDRLNLLLMSGQMPADMRQVLHEHLERIPYSIHDDMTDGLVRALDAVWLIMTSPQYAIQR